MQSNTRTSNNYNWYLNIKSKIIIHIYPFGLINPSDIKVGQSAAQNHKGRQKAKKAETFEIIQTLKNKM